MSRESRPGGRVILNGLGTPTRVGYGDGSPSWLSWRPERGGNVKVGMIGFWQGRPGLWMQVALDVDLSWVRASNGPTSEVLHLDSSASGGLVSMNGDVVTIRSA